MKNNKWLTLGCIFSTLVASASLTWTALIYTQSNVAIKGKRGANGKDGLNGANGKKGVKGDTGLTGIQGIQGLKGDTGAQGVQGVAGKDGVDGKDGITALSGWETTITASVWQNNIITNKQTWRIHIANNTFSYDDIFKDELVFSDMKKIKCPLKYKDILGNKNNFIEQGVVVNNKPLTTIKWHWETKEIR